jgi:hypothetical protein
MPSPVLSTQSLTSPLMAEILKPGDLWDIRRITGMRKVDGVEEFRVAWTQTWMPKSDLGGVRELVEEFRARLSVRYRTKNGQGKTGVTA